MPIGTGDYSLPSDKELYETIFLEDEIETIEDFLDIVEDEDIIVKKFFETK